jgi:hypothetical protein
MSQTSSPEFSWPAGQQAAVSLTYDDGLPVHHEQVAPALAARGLGATFYLFAHAGLTEGEGPRHWQKVAALGHELGNHTLFHPCRKETEANHPWLAAHYNLCDYTPDRWLDEVRVANCLLRLIDDRPDRTFGNTCCDVMLGRGATATRLETLVRRLFVAGRGGATEEYVTPANLNFGALGHFRGDRKSFVSLRQQIESAAAAGTWMILMLHGVGRGTHDAYIEADQHALLLDYLAENSARIWTAPLRDVAAHLQAAKT